MIQYKRFSTWDAIWKEEKDGLAELNKTRKAKPMEVQEQLGVGLERALNRLGKEGWVLCLAMNSGIFFYRQTDEDFEIPSILDVFGLPVTIKDDFSDAEKAFQEKETKKKPVKAKS